MILELSIATIINFTSPDLIAHSSSSSGGRSSSSSSSSRSSTSSSKPSSVTSKPNTSTNTTTTPSAKTTVPRSQAVNQKLSKTYTNKSGKTVAYKTDINWFQRWILFGWAWHHPMCWDEEDQEIDCD